MLLPNCVLVRHLFVAVGTGAADVGFLLGGSGAVGACDVGLLLGFGLYLGVLFALGTFGCSAEGDAAEDDAVNVVAAKCVVAHID